MTHLYSQVSTSTNILRCVHSQSGSKAKPDTTQELKQCLKLKSNTLGFELVCNGWLVFNMLIVAIFMCRASFFRNCLLMADNKVLCEHHLENIAMKMYLPLWVRSTMALSSSSV